MLVFFVLDSVLFYFFSCNTSESSVFFINKRKQWVATSDLFVLLKNSASCNMVLVVYLMLQWESVVLFFGPFFEFITIKFLQRSGVKKK